MLLWNPEKAQGKSPHADFVVVHGSKEVLRRCELDAASFSWAVELVKSRWCGPAPKRGSGVDAQKTPNQNLKRTPLGLSKGDSVQASQCCPGMVWLQASRSMYLMFTCTCYCDPPRKIMKATWPLAWGIWQAGLEAGSRKLELQASVQNEKCKL